MKYLSNAPFSSQPATAAYRDNFDKVFGVKEPAPVVAMTLRVAWPRNLENVAPTTAQKIACILNTAGLTGEVHVGSQTVLLCFPVTWEHVASLIEEALTTEKANTAPDEPDAVVHVHCPRCDRIAGQQHGFPCR
jgi:hypothetical protein